MINYFLLLFHLISFNEYRHDIQVAKFRIVQEADIVKMEISMEAADLANVLDMDSVDLTLESIQDYLNLQTSFMINGKSSPYTIQHMELKRKHLSIDAIFVEDFDVPITNLTIHNTCFVGIKGYSNIIELRLNGQERDFLMNKSRTQISVDY